MVSWRNVVQGAIRQFQTPFYLFSAARIDSALGELKALEGELPIRHWLSFKTAPIAPLIRHWKKLGRGVEVVSEYEFLAARKEGFSVDKILVNGVGKHTWLRGYDLPKIRVNLDSAREANVLARKALAKDWKLGFRYHVSLERDPDEPRFSTQFGMSKDEFLSAATLLSELGLNIETVHFHLRTNVPRAEEYGLAIKETAQVCKDAHLTPRFLDVGGGLPVQGEGPINGGDYQQHFDLVGLRRVFATVRSHFPSVTEVWMENGRFVTARAAVLVVRVVDIKERPDSRYLICDGGRTNHALVSDWEMHNFFVLPQRSGEEIHSTVCGPTCMAFDRLMRTSLPRTIQPGDYIAWMNAGAYHIPWETRFSGGLALVLWHDEAEKYSVAREKETFENWWGQWLSV